MPSFEQFLRLIKAGDPVQAGVPNRVLGALDQNVRYLWDLIQAAAVGSTVYLHQQTVEPAAAQGMAVYYNNDTQRFERGLAQATFNPAGGVVTTALSSQVWGVLAQKTNTTLGDVLLFGVDEVDISQAVQGAVTPGVYYLSGMNPGMLVTQKPPVTVAVLRVTPDGRVFVMPQFVDFLDRHTHYKFPLTCLPAGDVVPPAPGGHHTITNPNPLLPGWLPANHPSFNGLAPRLAVFGYNLAVDAALKNAWPPVPFSNVSIEWDKGLDPDVSATSIPLGEGGLCVVDRNGIWWLSDCYGDAPWPKELTNHDRSMSLSHSASYSYDVCPRPLRMSMTLWFARLNFDTDASTVLSLRPRDDRIKIYCLGTNNPAAVGDLEIGLDLNLTTTNNQPGSLALKTFDPLASEFQQGPMVEGVYPGSANVQVVGTIQNTVTINGQEQQIQQGLVAITVIPEDNLELDVQLVRLDGAQEQYYQGVMYLGLEAQEQTDYRAKIQVPAGLTLLSPQLKLRFLLLGRSQGTLPQLVFTGRLLSRPSSGEALALPLPAQEFTITCNTQVEVLDNNEYVEVESQPFAVNPGDTLFFTVQRLATDQYTDEVGVLRQTGVLIAGA